VSTSTASQRRWFARAQCLLIAYVVCETVLAWILQMPASKGANTHSVLFYTGDTALSPFLWLTALWVGSVWLAVRSSQSWLRGIGAVAATVFTVTYSFFNYLTVFAAVHQFTGWKWDLVVVLDSFGFVLSIACVLAALWWLVVAVKPARAHAQ
jgi:hypothetical protein